MSKFQVILIAFVTDPSARSRVDQWDLAESVSRQYGLETANERFCLAPHMEDMSDFLAYLARPEIKGLVVGDDSLRMAFLRPEYSQVLQVIRERGLLIWSPSVSAPPARPSPQAATKPKVVEFYFLTSTLGMSDGDQSEICFGVVEDHGLEDIGGYDLGWRPQTPEILALLAEADGIVIADDALKQEFYRPAFAEILTAIKERSMPIWTYQGYGSLDS